MPAAASAGWGKVLRDFPARLCDGDEPPPTSRLRRQKPSSSFSYPALGEHLAAPAGVNMLRVGRPGESPASRPGGIPRRRRRFGSRVVKVQFYLHYTAYGNMGQLQSHKYFIRYFGSPLPRVAASVVIICIRTGLARRDHLLWRHRFQCFSFIL